MSSPPEDRIHAAFVGSGTSYHVAKWLPALAEQGVGVTLFSFRPPPTPLPGVTVVGLTPPYARYTGRLSWFDFFGPPDSLRAKLVGAGVDVVIGSYATNYGAMAERAVRGTGLPFVLQTWTRDLSTYPAEGLRRFVLRPVVRRALNAADLITTDGAALAAYARSAYPALKDRVLSVRWGIRLEEFGGYPERREEARREMDIPTEATVVTSGRGVEAVYRPHPQLDAFIERAANQPEVYFLYLTVGQRAEEGVAEKLERLSAFPNARVFDRFLSRDEMADIWFASDFVVSVPEIDGISESLLEAMYCGAMPIVSDIASNRSFLNEEEGRALILPDSGRRAASGNLSAALSEAIQQVAGHRASLRRAVAEHNRTWVAEEASVEGTARLLAEHLRRLVHTSTPHPVPAVRRTPIPSA